MIQVYRLDIPQYLEEVCNPQRTALLLLAPLPREAVFDKVAMSAFEGTPLNTVFRDCKINLIHHCGSSY